jgi:quercetin dioxygenase-like cupin family protein
MSTGSWSVQPWTQAQDPTEAGIRQLFSAEKLIPYRWSNAPGDVYSAHTHSFFKVIYVLEGSITFRLPVEADEIFLRAGDRLDLPPGVVHSAIVGPQGVVCLEAQR